MAGDSIYFAGKNATLTVKGAALAVESGTFTDGVEVDEVTNNTSGGFYEDIDTTEKGVFNGMRCVYDGAHPPVFRKKEVVAIALAIPAVGGAEGPGITGNFRIGSVDWDIINAKGAVRYTFAATSQGPYEVTGMGEEEEDP